MKQKSFHESNQNRYERARRKAVKSNKRSNKQEASRPRSTRQEDQRRHSREREQRKTRPAEGGQIKKEKSKTAKQLSEILNKLQGRGKGILELETAPNELLDNIFGGPRDPMYRMLQNESFGAFWSLGSETAPNELP